MRALLNGKGSLNMEIFVVDNNSEDGSAEMVAKEFPEVNPVRNSSGAFPPARPASLGEAGEAGQPLTDNPDVEKQGIISNGVKAKRFSSHYVPWQEVCLIGVEKLTEEEPTEENPANNSETPEDN